VMSLGDITGGVAMVLLAIELVLLAGNVMLKRRGIIQPANVAGKVKMCLEVLGLVLLLSAFALHNEALALWATRTLIVAGGAALLSVVIGYTNLRRLLGLGTGKSALRSVAKKLV
jgi:phosphatidylglycerophosphate synthase